MKKKPQKKKKKQTNKQKKIQSILLFGWFLLVSGDQVYRKGALRGGHHDQRSSRLKLMSAFRAAMLTRQELQEKMNGIRTKIQDILYMHDVDDAEDDEDD